MAGTLRCIGILTELKIEKAALDARAEQGMPVDKDQLYRVIGKLAKEQRSLIALTSAKRRNNYERLNSKRSQL